MFRAILTALFAFGLLASPARGQADQADDIATARKIVQDFVARQQGSLKAAIEEGGLSNAVTVCHQVAPEIAAQASETSGWSVGRTALRLRNPGNAPSETEKAVLDGFLARAAAGEDLKEMEYSAVVTTAEGKRMLHYMKAIPLGKVCANCHGSKVTEALLTTIRAYYPEDQAIGFEVGELRGAFTLYKPLD